MARWWSRKPWTLCPFTDTDSAIIHRQISFVKNSESNWKGPAPKANKEPDSPKLVGRFRHPLARVLALTQSHMIRKRPLAPSFSQEKEELVRVSRTPTFPTEH